MAEFIPFDPDAREFNTIKDATAILLEKAIRTQDRNLMTASQKIRLIVTDYLYEKTGVDPVLGPTTPPEKEPA